MSDFDDLVAALAPVSAALSKLGIRHYVGDSVASSFHGASRSTMDVNLVAEMTDSHVSRFLKCFGQDFYLSEAAVRGRDSAKVMLQPDSSSDVISGRRVRQSPAAV